VEPRLTDCGNADANKPADALADSFLDAYPEIQVELLLNHRNLDLIGAMPDSMLLVRCLLNSAMHRH